MIDCDYEIVIVDPCEILQGERRRGRWRNWFASGSRDIENFNDPRVREENLGESFLCSPSIFVLINLCAIIVRFKEDPFDRFWEKK